MKNQLVLFLSLSLFSMTGWTFSLNGSGFDGTGIIAIEELAANPFNVQVDASSFECIKGSSSSIGTPQAPGGSSRPEQVRFKVSDAQPGLVGSVSYSLYSTSTFLQATILSGSGSCKAVADLFKSSPTLTVTGTVYDVAALRKKNNSSCSYYEDVKYLQFSIPQLNLTQEHSFYGKQALKTFQTGNCSDLYEETIVRVPNF